MRIFRPHSDLLKQKLWGWILALSIFLSPPGTWIQSPVGEALPQPPVTRWVERRKTKTHQSIREEFQYYNHHNQAQVTLLTTLWPGNSYSYWLWRNPDPVTLSAKARLQEPVWSQFTVNHSYPTTAWSGFLTFCSHSTKFIHPIAYRSFPLGCNFDLLQHAEGPTSPDALPSSKNRRSVNCQWPFESSFIGSSFV